MAGDKKEKKEQDNEPQASKEIENLFNSIIYFTENTVSIELPQGLHKAQQYSS